MKFKYWIIGLGILISIILCFVSCEPVEAIAEITYTEINPFEKLEVIFTGVDTYGKVELDISECDEFTKEHIEFIFDSVSLRNDDSIIVTATYNTIIAEEQLYKITIDTMEYTVSGLQEIRYIDPFDGLEVTYSGKSTDGVAQLDTSSCTDEIKEYVSYIYSDGLTNGDSIKINAILDEGITVEHGIALLLNEKEYIVSGLIEPLHIQFDKQKFLDAMNIAMEYILERFEVPPLWCFLTDITSDGMPELFFPYPTISSGSYTMYDISGETIEFVASDSGTPEFSNYVNVLTGKPVCVGIYSRKDYDNNCFCTDTYEVITYDGKVHGQYKVVGDRWSPSGIYTDGMVRKNLARISTKNFSDPPESDYQIGVDMTKTLSEIEILELIAGISENEYETVTKDEYDAALNEYYNVLSEISLPYAQALQRGMDVDYEELKEVFAELIAGYIESCEEIAQTQSEWLVFEIIND